MSLADCHLMTSVGGGAKKENIAMFYSFEGRAARGPVIRAPREFTMPEKEKVFYNIRWVAASNKGISPGSQKGSVKDEEKVIICP